MIRSITSFLLVLFFYFSVAGCDEESGGPLDKNPLDTIPYTTIADTTGTVLDSIYFVTLQNETEFSGIMARILELGSFVVTGSIGLFQFDSLPDGHYTLEARYPFFSTETTSIVVSSGKIQDTIHMELQQLVTFEIEPSDTTISLDSLQNSWQTRNS